MSGAQRAGALTKRLLAFARRQPLDPKPLNANLVVQGMSELLRRSLGETVELETVLGGGLWTIEADPNEFESALLNLALNARDAMASGGGKLTIETANAHLDEAYAARHSEVTPGQYVLVSVTDTGTGMDAETTSRVFEPFFTTKGEGKGTGLGLSQVYGFVKQSGGHVKLYSELGRGTTVRIYLPRRQGDAVHEEAEDARLAPEAFGETILVVEDDPDVRAYSVGALQELGYQVVEAHDGPSAVRLLEQRSFDLVFTDVVLPGGMTGAQVVARAVQLWPGIKTLFTTGYARNAIVHHGRLDPGVHLITKPFTFDDLAAKVRDVLDQKKA
jgi:CheY-like chemotaxis protein